MDEVKVGDWLRVKTTYDKYEVIGFIDKIESYRIFLQPIKPYSQEYKILYKQETNTYRRIEQELNDEMIDDMIDLALDIRDEKWFKELIEMRSR